EKSFSFYRLAPDGVVAVWQSLPSLGQSQFAEIDRLMNAFVSSRGAFEKIGSTALLERMRKDEGMVRDVRPSGAYRAAPTGPAPSAGARALPVDELKRLLKHLPKRRGGVASCRGPFCVFADEAVLMLRRNGYRARRLDVGFPDWKAAGLPTARL